jgi:transposase
MADTDLGPETHLRPAAVAKFPVPVGVKMCLATGRTDVRNGFASLALQAQEVFERDPLGGHAFCFRSLHGDVIKIIWHNGQTANLYVRRLEKGRFMWPSPAAKSSAITLASNANGPIVPSA